MVDIQDLIIALKHHAFICNENNRNCSYCPYDKYGEDCEIKISRDAILVINELRNEKDALQKRTAVWKGWEKSYFKGCDDCGEPIWGRCVYYICSNCGRRTVIQDKFCPNCGFMMEKEM